jgi:hypothetical protein
LRRVTGIGGIFFKANDPGKLRDWYRVHLGIECEKEGGVIFKLRKAEVSKLGAMHSLGSISKEHRLLRAEHKAFHDQPASRESG